MGKRKAKGRKIPLSALDKFMYFLIGCVGVVLSIAALLGLAMIPDHFTYQADPTAFACRVHDVLAVSSLLFSFLLFAPVYAFACHWYTQKQPLFGNKHFKARFSSPVIPTYPLFSKKYFASLDEKYKKAVKKLMIAWAVSVFASLCFLLPTICLRSVIYENDTVKKFDSFNNVSHSCNIASADKLTLTLTRNTSSKGRSVSYGLTFTFGYTDHSHEFSFYSLRDELTTEEKLRYLLRQKEFFGDNCETEGIEYIDDFIREDKLNSTEKALLYELFDRSLP